MHTEVEHPLIQEAERCNKSFCYSKCIISDDHLVKVFTKLILQGNIQTAVRWFTEFSGGGELKSFYSNAVSSNAMYVVDALQLKHSDLKITPQSVFPCCIDFPCLEDP